MAPVSAETAYDDIFVHIRQRGASFNLWHVGVAPDAVMCMMGDHHVRFSAAGCIYRTCLTPLAARSVKQALLALGCQGPAAGEDPAALQVYAYLSNS